MKIVTDFLIFLYKNFKIQGLFKRHSLYMFVNAVFICKLADLFKIQRNNFNFHNLFYTLFTISGRTGRPNYVHNDGNNICGLIIIIMTINFFFSNKSKGFSAASRFSNYI
jgi:hypothetical protein